MVWAFDRMTGKGGKITPALTGIDGKTHALSRVTIEPFPKEGGCRVCYYGRVKVACTLPKSFLNVLPLSKRRFQERINKSIVKQLEKEGVQSIDKFSNALGKWANQSDIEAGDDP